MTTEVGHSPSDKKTMTQRYACAFNHHTTKLAKLRLTGWNVVVLTFEFFLIVELLRQYEIDAELPGR